MSFHPKGEEENAGIMPRKLNEKGYFVLNLGGIASVQKGMYKDWLSGKALVGMYSDCAAQFGGFFHVGLRGKIFKIGKHWLEGGLGPTLVYRKNWLSIEEYKNLNRFKGGKEDKWQYMFLWYGG